MENKNMKTENPSCQNMMQNLVNAGKFILEQEARDSLNAYFAECGLPPGDENHIYGHTFGLNKLEELIDKMKSYNNGKPTENQLLGVRVYYGKCVRDDEDFPLNPPNGMFRDVFFMPVLANGCDLYTIRPIVVSDIILGAGRPCPNQCSTPLHFVEL